MKIDSAAVKVKWSDYLGLGGYILALAFLWLIGAAVQAIWPQTISPYFHFGAILLCGLLFLPLVRVERLRIAKAILCGLFLLAMVALWFSPVSTRQPFLRDLDRVETGMTLAQVEAIMGGYMKGTGWPEPPPFTKSPTPQSSKTQNIKDLATGSTHQIEADKKGELQIAGAVTYRHSDEGEYNSDWGVVSFQNGRVSKVEFMPD